MEGRCTLPSTTFLPCRLFIPPVRFSLLDFVFYCEVDAGSGTGEGADDGGGGGLDGDGAGVGGGELETVEENGGTFGVDAVACQGRDEEGDGDLDGFDVFEWWEIELEWSGFGQALVGFCCTGRGFGLIFEQDWGVFDQMLVAAVQAGVEVAEGRLAEGWGICSGVRWF